jgi:hypothetical protein
LSKGKIMLKSFRVANHRSIRDQQELILVPAYDKGRDVVPVAAIYGANASGKSNLLDAFHWLKFAVLQSFATWLPGSGIPRKAFALSHDSAERPTAFDVDLLIGQTRYVYRLELDDERVLVEELVAYPNRRPRLIFRRERDEITFGSTLSESRTRQAMWSRLTRDNVLFLAVAALNDVAEVGPLYQWFRTGCNLAMDAPDLDEADLIAWLNGERGKTLTELIKVADLGVKDIEVRHTSFSVPLTPQLLEMLTESGAIELHPRGMAAGPGERLGPFKVVDHAKLGQIVQGTTGKIAESRVSFYQGAHRVALSLDDQSAGTRSWIRLACLALKVLDDGGALLVDEVDASFHPHLTSRLINLFRDAEINKSGAQLIFTTHDATLLNDEVLARDEIWFVEKDPEDGATRIYPLTDFHPRKNENTEGRYLAGSYGAVPVLADYRFRAALIDRDSADAAA